MKGGVLSNKVAFCEQQIGEPGPWGGSVTLEVTDPLQGLVASGLCTVGGTRQGRLLADAGWMEARRPARWPRPPSSGRGELVSATKEWKEAGSAGAGH